MSAPLIRERRVPPENPPYFTDLQLRERTSQAAGMLAAAAPTYGTRRDAGGDATATSPL
jgi:hypothetical protein